MSGSHIPADPVPASRANAYLKRFCRSYLGQRLPTKQLLCTETSGERFAHLARCAPVALARIPGLEGFVELLTGVHNSSGKTREAISCQAAST